MICNLACPVLSYLPRTRGRCCVASLKEQSEREKRNRQALAVIGATTQTHAHGQDTDNSTQVFQRARGVGEAAVMPAHSAEQRKTAPVQLPAERARISSTVASRLRSRTAADDIADTSDKASGSPYDPSTANGTPEPGGAAGKSLRASGACYQSVAVL